MSDWQDDLVGPTVLSGAEVEALDLAGIALPTALRTHYRRGARHGWDLVAVYWRRPALRADGSVKPCTRDVPQFDPEYGTPLLTPTGRPQVKKVDIEGSALVQDSFILRGALAWEGYRQQLVAIWTEGKFEAAWCRWPHLEALSSTELKTFMESGGTPPERQRGVPATLWEQRAARAAAKEEDEDE